MKKNMKQLILMFILLAIGVVLFTACGVSQPNFADECVRIHIRANSNEDCDQTVKLKVRDAITSYLTLKLEGCADKSAAVNVLSNELPNLNAIANKTLSANGYDYKSRVSLTNEYFPERDYEGYVFPEGNYDALIIELGSGKGNNWWCVAFPPLCFVPDSVNGEKIVYKSWIKEMLDKLFA